MQKVDVKQTFTFRLFCSMTIEFKPLFMIVENNVCNSINLLLDYTNIHFISKCLLFSKLVLNYSSNITFCQLIKIGLKSVKHPIKFPMGNLVELKNVG